MIIATPNVDHIVRLHESGEFKAAYKGVDVFVNDSRVVKKLSHYIGKPIRSLIPGSDLTRLLIENINGKDLKVCFIGGSSQTVEKIVNDYKLISVNHYNPPMGFINNQTEVTKCVKVCLASESDLGFLAVGSPRQELLACELKKNNLSACILCVGAALLFLSGEERRAPVLFQRLSLEWLYRLLQSPRRLARRYLVDGPVIFRLAYLERRKELLSRKDHR